MYTITKRYTNLKAAHRQWKHPGHCAGIHGENWTIDFTFKSDTLDNQNFVIDFGNLGALKKFLEDNFDHTLLLDKDDPCLPDLQLLVFRYPTMAKIVPLASASAEGIAKFVFDFASDFIHAKTNGRVFLARVEVYEDEKNSASYFSAYNP